MTWLLGLALLIQAYTVNDPIDPARLGLALPGGRFLLEPIEPERCAWLVAGMNVQVSSELSLVTITDGEQICEVHIEQIMSETPCFGWDDICDVRAEVDE